MTVQGPRKGTATRRNVTQGGGRDALERGGGPGAVKNEYFVPFFSHFCPSFLNRIPPQPSTIHIPCAMPATSPYPPHFPPSPPFSPLLQANPCHSCPCASPPPQGIAWWPVDTNYWAPLTRKRHIPRHIQHSPGTPTTGLRERGNDTSRSTGRSGRQNAATRRNMRRGERVTVQGPRNGTTTRRNVTQGRPGL